MVLLPPEPKRRERFEHEATVDHLRSRLHPERKEPAYGARRLVMACLRCNEERARLEVAGLSREELHRRACNGHKKQQPQADGGPLSSAL